MTERLARADQWYVDATRQGYQVKFNRGATKRAEVNIFNNSNAAVTAFVQAITELPLVYRRDIQNTTGANAGNAMGQPAWYYPMTEAASPFANAGLSATAGVLNSGAVSTTNRPGGADTTPIYNSVTGIVTFNNGNIIGQLTQWTLVTWLNPTALSGATVNVFYRENNAGLTHFIAFYIDTDGRLAVQANNGGGAVTAKNAAGPVIAANSGWHQIVITNNAGTVHFYLDGADVGTSVTALPTFVDANTAIGGMIQPAGFTGFMTNPALWQSKTATLPWVAWTFNEMGFSYYVANYASEALLIGNSLNLVLGEGTGLPFPPILVIGVQYEAAAASGMWSVEMIE